ncbi:hypothetical protein C8J57DRAFT_1047482, partial [Mycena rebaudengoi]
DEVLQLIFFELPAPGALAATSKRLRAFSQDPYVRAHYFLTRYGRIQAFYYALARGKLLTDRVLDACRLLGAHLSRYLIQVAIHHFFYTQTHFIKSSMPWVRNVPLATFSYFLKLAADKYGEIPRGKVRNEDDGSTFATFIKQAKLPPESQRVSWDKIKEIFENYNFIPFCNSDPLMAQFPLALAIEPRLLPYARDNGFQMDSKYRDFVFRKMFERSQAAPTSSAAIARHADEIVVNVRELCRLDPAMFVTRTVAAEVCLEAKTNDAAYNALKKLDRAGDLPFTLSALVQDLIKLFVKSRAVTTASTTQTLNELYTDFLAPPPPPASSRPSASKSTALRIPVLPSAFIDPTVRLVMLLSVFAADPTPSLPTIKTRLAALRMGPLTRRDAVGLMCSPFLERSVSLIEYLKREGGWTHADVRSLVEEVAVRCLEIECKGKTLRKLSEIYPTVRVKIVQAVLGDHQMRVEDLPECDGEAWYRAKLGRPMSGFGARDDSSDEQSGSDDSLDESDSDDDSDGRDSSCSGEWGRGTIGLEPLTQMIRRDELPGRGRRRMYYANIYGLATNNSPLPPDPLAVGKWIKAEFGTYSSVTATFLKHALANGNTSLLHSYIGIFDPLPITLTHFQILARLGRATSDFYLYERIRQGATFYASEEDYLHSADSVQHLLKKLTRGGAAGACTRAGAVSRGGASGRGARPRRTAPSYLVPDSDDEAIAEEEDAEYAEYRTMGGAERKKKMIKGESHLERWIKELGELLKEEQRKYREKKKAVEKAAEPGTKIRVPKNEFFRSLAANLRTLRLLDEEKRKFRSATGDDAYYSEDEDEDYVQEKAPRSKKRKTSSVMNKQHFQVSSLSFHSASSIALYGLFFVLHVIMHSSLHRIIHPCIARPSNTLL